ncbi:hypothetical protein P4H71_01735 [Paenibacillus kribbensis]|uniref:hypothetical protein n=1 Tax=Paenibacillus kribbensis TaxID=172713 RepID=UPI002DB5BDDC|nr:hypothetical protein [Paenibacillus kribbensis]MEC0233077.1 hypothetical protein [Paenibacillus kribbensis]
MASEKTPNLGLNQIDRTSPKTTYFDLEKYLDQNWRTVDDFAGDVNDGVNAIKKRLDTTERKAVTLEPGVQIVHAEKVAPFSLTGLSGRTLVNLLGRWGNLSSLTGILPYQSDLVLDTLNKGTMLNSLKVTIKSGYTVGVGFYSNFKFLAGKYYIAIAKAKVGNATNAGISAPTVLAGTKVTDKTKFTTTWFRLAPTSDVTSNIDLVIEGTEGQYSYFEAVRIYEISASEYAALAEMTGEQIDAKYPYVDSVMPVRNPYAIRYGENLLPPFYEWQATGHKISIDSPYSIEGELLSGAIGTDAYSVIHLDVIPNTEYTITNPAESTGKMRISTYNSAGTRIQGIFINPGESRVIKMDASAVRIGVHISGVTQYTNEFNVDTWSWPVGTKRKFYNPILNIGNTAKIFKPREDSMLALQTDLYTDLITGANSDSVFERNGQYFKVKKWQNIVLDGNREYGFYTSTVGIKTVGSLNNGIIPAIDGTGVVTKFDGKVIKESDYLTVISQADSHNIGSSESDGTYNNFQIGVSFADSGWGDNYTPTPDEIKAYFMGWVMFKADQANGYVNPDTPANNLYNGTGQKAWARRGNDGVTRSWSEATTSLPVTQATGWTPYQLVYQLATPTVEPIVSEGQLSFTEGDNQVEVGSGIVLRENVKPAGDSVSDSNVQINRIDYGTAVKYRTDKFLSVYVGNRKDSGWEILRVQDGQTYGFERVRKPRSQTSVTEPYSVTYLMLDKSPVTSFVGIYATNEKTLLADLVDSIQQNTARVSVLENKKMDRDSTPVRFYPTLINGWEKYFDYSPSFYKDSLGLVHLEGIVKNGVMDKAIFVLPKGFRPKSSPLLIGVASHNQTSSSRIEVGADGQVIVYNASAVWTNLSDVSFLAEQ